MVIVYNEEKVSLYDSYDIADNHAIVIIPVDTTAKGK